MASKKVTVTYTCSNKKCGDTQTLTFWDTEHPLPVTCCVKCKAGFGKELDVMIGHNIGMFPGEAVPVIEDERIAVDLTA